MSLVRDIGVCKQSGCEAIAIAGAGSFTIVARTELFADFDMSHFAVTDVTSVRNLLRESLTSYTDIDRLQWLAGILDRKVNRSLPLEDLIHFFLSRLSSGISVFHLTGAPTTREDFLNEANRPTRIRMASVSETHQIESAQSVFQMTIANLSPALRERLRAYTEPRSVLLMATVFVAVVAMGSNPPWSGIILVALWVLIGWQAFSIARILGEAVALYLEGNFKGCARRLADVISAIGEAFMMLLIGLAGRLIRPAPRIPLAPRINPPPAAATPLPGETLMLSESEYFNALSQVFPSQYVDRLARLVDLVGQDAAAQAVADPKFVAAIQAGEWRLAGTLFHSAAAHIARNIGGLPAGWTLAAEETVQTGSRVDLVLRGPAGEIAIVDWKTSGGSALRSIPQMNRYAGIIRARALGRMTELRSASWVDYMRPLLAERDIVI